MEERIPSIKVTDKETGNVYELDFNRDSVRFAEARGFDTDDVRKYPATKIPELFFYSFRAHHKMMSKDQTDRLLKKLGGMNTKVLGRLLDLYNQAGLTGVLSVDDGDEKNSEGTWEL